MDDFKKRLLEIGYLGKPVGYKGHITAHFFDNLDIQFSEFIFISQDGLPVPFKLTTIDDSSNPAQLKIQGVDQKEDAMLYKGLALFIEKENVEVQEEEHSGYLDFEIEHKSEIIGRIRSTENHGQNILAQVELTNGKLVFLPLNEDLILSIDSQKKVLRMEIVEGLLELY